MSSASDIIFSELRKRRVSISLVVFFMLLGSGVALIQPLLFKMLFDSAIPEKDTTLVWWLLAGMVAVPILAIGLAYLQGHLRVRIGESVALALRKEAFNNLIHARITQIESFSTGGIVYRITRDAGKIGEVYIAQELLPVASSMIMLLGTLGTMFMLNAKLTGILLLAMPVTYIVTRYLSQFSKALDSQLNENSKESESFLYEVLRGLRTIRTFHAEVREKNRWAEHMDRRSRLKKKGEALHQLMLNFPNDIINGLVVGVLLGFGAFQVMANSLTIGSLIAFMAYAPRAYNALRSILTTYVGTKLIDVSIKSLDEVFALSPEPGPRQRRQKLPTKEIAPTIEFSNVHFKYDRKFGVEDLSFKVERGEFVGIVGPTGGGKTTIIDLLTRMYDPDHGVISVNGIDIRDLSLKELREYISVVPQDVFLWNSTLAENIAYPDITFEMAGVVDAARRAGIDDFINQQPEKYLTVAGEGGISLSGGERQRIAIARSLRRPARILLLDEATSALDAMTELKIRRAIDHARAYKTTIVIAHRLSTVLHADRLFVIKEGRLIESGPAEVLKKSGKVFSDLFRAQSLNLKEKGNTSS